MSFLRRRSRVADGRPFWEVPPCTSTDPAVFYEHGIQAVTRGDGPGMIAAGWALWELAGLNQHQAYDFLYDGYQKWCDSGATGVERAALLDALVNGLRQIHPAISPTADLSAYPPWVAAPAARYYGARCWAIVERLDLSRQTAPMTAEETADLLHLLDQTHPDFRSARASAASAAHRGTSGPD